MSTTARRALAVLLALHAVAHLAGGGVATALVAAAFAGAAVLTWRDEPAWPRVLAGVALASAAVLAFSLWASAIGVVVDAALLGVAWRAGALRRPEPGLGRSTA